MEAMIIACFITIISLLFSSFGRGDIQSIFSGMRECTFLWKGAECVVREIKDDAQPHQGLKPQPLSAVAHNTPGAHFHAQITGVNEKKYVFIKSETRTDFSH